MNSNEKCVTALQALLNVTYASGPGKLAPPPRVFLEDFNDGTLYSTTVSGHALGASVVLFFLLLKLQEGVPQIFSVSRMVN